MIIWLAIFNILSWWEITIVIAWELFSISLNISAKLWKLHKSIPASGSSKIPSKGLRAKTLAISILFNSPPDKELFISLSKYSGEVIPTLFNKFKASSLDIF